MSAENGSEIDVYDLALLAAQLMCRQSRPHSAVETAWQLLEEAKDKLEGIQLRAQTEAPEAQAEWKKLRAEQLEALRYCYHEGVKMIVFGAFKGQRLDRAEAWLRKFLEWKTRGRGEKEPEAWAQAKVLLYRNRGFSGTEVTRLQSEFSRWRDKGTQGRMRRKASDERLSKVKQDKLGKKGREAWAKFSKPKMDTKAYVRVVTGRNPSFDGAIFPDRKSDDSRRPPDETRITLPDGQQNTA